MAKKHSTDGTYMTSCALSAGKIMLAQFVRGEDGNARFVAVMSPDDARALSAALIAAVEVAERSDALI